MMGLFSRLFGTKSREERKEEERERFLNSIGATKERRDANRAESDRKYAEMVAEHKRKISGAPPIEVDPPLSERDEAVAQKIKKLLLSASFHESRDQRAFNNLSSQMQKIGETIRERGREHWDCIENRVVVLCAEHYVGLAQYYGLLGTAPEA